MDKGHQEYEESLALHTWSIKPRSKLQLINIVTPTHEVGLKKWTSPRKFPVVFWTIYTTFQAHSISNQFTYFIKKTPTSCQLSSSTIHPATRESYFNYKVSASMDSLSIHVIYYMQQFMQIACILTLSLSRRLALRRKLLGRGPNIQSMIKIPSLSKPFLKLCFKAPMVHQLFLSTSVVHITMNQHLF
jgi:hypothetical protein